MKNIVLYFISSILIAYNGFGQTKKNDLKFTASALPLFGSSDVFEPGLNGVVVNPSIGYFISDKTSIDLNFSHAFLNNLTIGNTDSYYNSYAFIPTLRHGFVNMEKLRVFAEFGFGLGTIKYRADNNSLRNFQHEYLSGGISILNVGIGGNYFFNENFGIELFVPYLITKNITSDYYNILYSGIGPTIGFVFVMN